MCGILGLFGVRDAATLLTLGLHGLQHRGGDGVGIVTTDGNRFYVEGGHGTVYQVLPEQKLALLPGETGIVHARYPTSSLGESASRETLSTIQPILGRYSNQAIAVAHNGNITNLEYLDTLLTGVTRTTSMDTEYVLRLLELYETGHIEQDLAHVLSLLEGSVTLVILLPDRLIAVRDKSGCRPLSIGKVGDGYCVASEDCVFPSLRAAHVMDVEPGTMVTIDANGCRVTRFAEPTERRCIFEHVYFAKAESVVFGKSVSEVRMDIGRRLARVCAIERPHLVVPVPLSSIPIAVGYAEATQWGRFYAVLSRNLDRTSAARTFTAGNQNIRCTKVARKFNVNQSAVRGKVVLVIDDSIVRGTTMPGIVDVLRWCGAVEVHVAVGSPPFTHQCFYGIYTPTEEELLAASRSIEEMRAHVGADSLTFLPQAELREAVQEPDLYCSACTDGQYW